MVIKMKKRYCAITLLWLLLIGLSLSACGQKALSWQKQYDLGVRYLSEGNYEEAIIAFTAAIKIDPKQAPAYVGRGDAYIGSGETEENLAAALADYEQAIGLDETNAEAYLCLADVYIRQGKYEKASETLHNGVTATGNEDLRTRLEEVYDLEAKPSTKSTESASAVVATGSCGDNVWWSYDENTQTLTIGGNGTMEDYIVKEYDDGVVAIGITPWEKYQNSIKNIVIEDGVNNIGAAAFNSCSNLSDITISDSMTIISRFSLPKTLYNIHYSGTKQQRETISIADMIGLQNAAIHYNSVE